MRIRVKWKIGQMNNETKREVAIELAIQAGLLERCGACSEVYDTWSNDNEGAYEIASLLITMGSLRVEIFKVIAKSLLI